MLHATKPGDTKADFAAWIGMLGPPVVWITYFEIIYARVMPACATGTKAGLLFASIVCFVLIAGCGLLAGCQLASPGERGARRFMGQIGLMSAALFALLAIAQTIAMFIIDPCVM